MATFAADHEVAAIRGGRILEHREVREELERRIAWLVHRITIMKIERRPFGQFRRELKVSVMLLDHYNDSFPPDEYDTLVPPADDSEPGTGEAAE
jgi:hypothetical protein